MMNVYIVEIVGISELRIANPNSRKHRIANPMQRTILRSRGCSEDGALCRIYNSSPQKHENNAAE